MMLSQLEFGKENWAYKVKKVICEQGFGIVWMFQEVGNEQLFLSEFKDRLICSFKQNWHSDMEDKDKYNWFFSFKSTFETEKYLSVVTDKWHRINFARFRLRTFGFNANKRWFQPETSTELPCPMCRFYIDDEKHFLFQCKAYDKLRDNSVFFKSDVAKRQNVAFALASDNEIIIKSIAKFIAEANKLRQSYVEQVC
jgi:hypothetical protein